ncbi:MAG: chemotaxis protein CheX [Chloroflexi bacterium]|nr:chemotaxis protein CheX [Chloroflexota bacterium]
MDDRLAVELLRATASTFEDLCFMFLVSEPEEGSAPIRPRAVAQVLFRGPLDGRLTVQVDRAVLRSIAVNMLGDEEAPSSAQQRDALGELANVICGHLLPRVTSPLEVFQMGAPRVRELRASAPDGGDPPAAAVQVLLDEGPAEVRLFLDAKPRKVRPSA